MEKTFFLCSEGLIKHFKTSEHSRPFKSGFENDNDNYYVALLDFIKKINDLIEERVRHYM